MWRGGDRTAGTELFIRLYRMLCDWQRRHFPREDSEVVQDALLRLCRHPDRYRGRCKLTSYLFRIMHNRVIDIRRTRRGRVRVVPLDGFVAEDRVDVESFLMEGERRACVLVALEGLPDDVRRIVELHYWHEHTVEQIGDILGMPVGTVKSKLQWARRRMRPVLERATLGAPTVAVIRLGASDV